MKLCVGSDGSRRRPKAAPHAAAAAAEFPTAAAAEPQAARPATDAGCEVGLAWSGLPFSGTGAELPVNAEFVDYV